MVQVQKINQETQELRKEIIPPLGSNTKWGLKRSENAEKISHKCYFFPCTLYRYFPVDFIEHKFSYCARFNIRKVTTAISWTDFYQTRFKMSLMR